MVELLLFDFFSSWAIEYVLIGRGRKLL